MRKHTLKVFDAGKFLVNYSLTDLLRNIFLIIFMYFPLVCIIDVLSAVWALQRELE